MSRRSVQQVALETETRAVARTDNLVALRTVDAAAKMGTNGRENLQFMGSSHNNGAIVEPDLVGGWNRNRNDRLGVFGNRAGALGQAVHEPQSTPAERGKRGLQQGAPRIFPRSFHSCIRQVRRACCFAAALASYLFIKYWSRAYSAISHDGCVIACVEAQSPVPIAIQDEAPSYASIMLSGSSPWLLPSRSASSGVSQGWREAVRLPVGD